MKSLRTHYLLRVFLGALLLSPYLAYAIATCTSKANGDWDQSSTWSCTGSPIISKPDSNALVILASPYTVNLVGDIPVAGLTIDFGATLNDNNKDLSVSGNVIVNGTYGLHGGGNLIMQGANSTLSGTSGNFNGVDIEIKATGISIPAGSTISMSTNDKFDVKQNASLTIAGTINAPLAKIEVDKNASVTNNGAVTINRIKDDNSTSIWTQGNNSSLTFTGTPTSDWDSGGIFNASATNNTVTYQTNVTALTPSSNTYYNINHPSCGAVSRFTILGSSPCGPSVTSINRNSSNPTSAGASVSWVVTFNINVTGVNSADFALVTTGGISGSSITSVSGSGTTWTVTANTGSVTTSGTLGLNLVDDDTIIDSASKKLGGTGLGNGNFTGQTYTVNSAGLPATCSSGNITGVINTYYSVTKSASAGATSITVGGSSGASTSITAGDLILIMQMQDATIDTTNTANYGTTSSINAGKYEYGKVVAVSGSTLTLATGLVNSYTYQAGSDTVAQKTFQVIRVPVYSSATLSTGVTAKAWDGATGGVVVFDVVGVLTLNGQTIDVSGKGFRGGGGRMSWAGSGANTDYRTSAKTNGANGSKGEGTAGTPYRTFDGSTTVTGAVEGYPNGSGARGAPATGGGGGTDGRPSINDQNTGGGGGGNYGAGGQGGIGWCETFNANSAPNYGCPNTGGFGGKASTLSASQLTLGGGGGAGTSNNGTGTPGDGVASSGARGGGIIMLRAGSLSGTATMIADGSAGNSSVVNDGSGGGGAAGAVIISAATGLSGVIVSAKGGKGGDNLAPPNNWSSPHGPGGGGGGGYVLTSGATGQCNVVGGSNGVTYEFGVNTPFGAYGASSGSGGACVTTLTSNSIPGLTLGNGPCLSGVAHYAITYPNGNQKSTCETMTVRIAAHDTAHGDVTPTNSTAITLSANISGTPATVSWSKKTGGGTFNSATNTYTFSGSETFAEFNLARTTVTASPHIDIDVTDGSKTDIDGDTDEDAKAQFSTASANFYSDTIGTPASIPTLTAGTNSNTYYVKVVGFKNSCTTTLTGTRTVTMGYQCEDPTSCYTTSAPACGAGNSYLCFTPYDASTAQTAQALPANNQSSTSSTVSFPLIFDANGYAPITFNYLDVGKINLFMTQVDSFTVAGSTNNFLVKPAGFSVIPCKSSVTGECTTAPTAPDLVGGGSTFVKAGETFKTTIKAIASNGSTTPSYGLGSANDTEKVNLSMLRQAPTGANTRNGNLNGTGTSTGTALYRNNFTDGVVTLSDLSWDEVGVIQLVATNTGFLRDSNVTTVGNSGNLGRFYPDHFGLTGSLITRSDLQTVEGQITPFTYMGEPMLINVNVTAYSINDDVTQNYTGDYAKLNASSLTNWNGVGCTSGNQCFGLGAINGTTPLSSRLTVMPNPTSTWNLGSGNFTFNLTFDRNATGVDGPFDALSIGAAPQDTDGVMLRASTSTTDAIHALNLDVGSVGGKDRRLIATTKIRYGRLHLVNAYGSELLDSRVEVRAEYWDGNRWAINTLDKILTLAKENVFSSNPSGSVTTPPAVKTITQFSAGSGGSGFIIFNRTNLPGSFDIALNLSTTGNDSSCNANHGGTASNMPWLKAYWSAPANCGNVAGWAQDPNARIKLGSPKAPYIYLRERY